jgi:hypothetical protein
MNKQFIKLPENIEDLYPLVELECKLIKENFTSEEINKLELDLIDSTSQYDCVYGKMVGDCNDPKVNSFINNNLDKLILSRYSNIVTFDETDRALYYMTPLEEYIYERDNPYENDFEIVMSETTKKRIQKVLNLLKN